MRCKTRVRVHFVELVTREFFSGMPDSLRVSSEVDSGPSIGPCFEMQKLRCSVFTGPSGFLQHVTMIDNDQWSSCSRPRMVVMNL